MSSALVHRPAQNSVGAPARGPQQESPSSFPSSRSQSTRSSKNGQVGYGTQASATRGSESSSISSNQPSKRSSLSAGNPPARKHGHDHRLRSQYPADSSENHVEYILVASFDIDRGSVMEHQYPGPISGDEHMLAELMLPDQAHVRSQDWTVFFLHKDTNAEEEAREERKKKRRWRRDQANVGAEANDAAPVDEDEGEDLSDGSAGDTDAEGLKEEQDMAEGPPLIYVLNLVNTKQDNTVKRRGGQGNGDMYTSLFLTHIQGITRFDHLFSTYFKTLCSFSQPLLLLALEGYFRAPVPETLASLYHAVNSMDLSLMPRLTYLERYILQASDAKDMFVEKFAQMIQQRMSSVSSSTQPNNQTIPRPAVPRDTHEFESRVLYNGIPIPIKIPTAVSSETVGDFSLIKLIQTFSTPHSTSPQPFALHPHLTTSGAYTHPIIVLVNALLTQKRIVFLGHNQPSSSVAEAVLAACALASGSGLLRGFTRHAFPYTDLTKIDDLLKVPGFIAGVTNPAFALKPEWWDLLCDLPTGRMKISHRIEGAPVTEGLLFFQQPAVQQQASLGGGGGSSSTANSLAAGLGAVTSIGAASSGTPADPTGDNAFMEALLHAIAHRHGEAAIRARWRDWVHKFTRVAAAFEECVYGASALYVGASETDVDSRGYGVAGHGYVWGDEASRMRELAANASRVEGWRSTRSYYSFVQDLARVWRRRGMCVRGIDLRHQHDRLKGLKLGHELSAAIYLALARVVERAGEDEVEEVEEQEGEGEGEGGAVDAEARMGKRESARYDIINQLLIVTPESNGGLFYISLGLFHPRADVRAAVAGLLGKIMEHQAGRHFWASLGRFAKLAFFRVKREMEGLGRG